MEQVKFRSPKNTDWHLFNEHLANTSSINSRAELDEVAGSFNKALVDSFNLACPGIIIKADRAAEFFSSDIKKIRKKLRAAFNQAKPGRQNADNTRRRTLRKEYESGITKDQFSKERIPR